MKTITRESIQCDAEEFFTLPHKEQNTFSELHFEKGVYYCDECLDVVNDKIYASSHANGIIEHNGNHYEKHYYMSNSDYGDFLYAIKEK